MLVRLPKYLPEGIKAPPGINKYPKNRKALLEQNHKVKLNGYFNYNTVREQLNV